MSGRKIILLSVAFLAMTAMFIFCHDRWLVDRYAKYKGRRIVSDALSEFGGSVEARLVKVFKDTGVEYPPRRMTLVAIKDEKSLELWVETGEVRTLVKKYPILAASGKSGPKLAEGDMQVPEGLYRIAGLNPNSSYHLSMKVDYPNGFDRSKALADGRTRLGGDIFIHGGDASIGCIAIGDEAIEELFVMAAAAIKNDIKVIISPYDMRVKNEDAASSRGVSWLPELYGNIRSELIKYK